jgi:NHL repeat
VAVDGQDNVYVADYGNFRIQKFDSSGVFQLAWGSKGSGNGQFDSGPFGVAVDPAGSLYVTDPGNSRIQKFDGSGVFKFAWGSQGSGSGQFKFGYYSLLGFQNPEPSPGGVAVDLQGNVYVLDPGNFRCQQFYEIETPELTFQPVAPQNMAIFVLGSDGNLWLETGPFGTQIPPARLQVDSNAVAFQAPDVNDVIVLGSDGNLWLETQPFGNVAQTIQTRRQIDGNVAAFQAVLSGYGDYIFVLGTDGNLWWETWPPSGSVAQTIATRQQIDANVKKFVPLDVYDVFVLGGDGNLWWEGLPFGNVAQTMKNRKQVDANVKTFQPIDGYNIYVLGTDGNLWLESWPLPPPGTPSYDAWGNVQETMQNRKQVDGNVAAFQAVDVNTVFVLGQDGNLWLETSPWGNVGHTVETRQHVDTNIEAFYVWVDEHNMEGNWMVFVKDTDHALWYDISPPPPSTTWTRVQVDRNVM